MIVISRWINNYVKDRVIGRLQHTDRLHKEKNKNNK